MTLECPICRKQYKTLRGMKKHYYNYHEREERLEFEKERVTDDDYINENGELWT